MKKGIAWVLTVCLFASLCVGFAAEPATFKDISGHWAQLYIQSVSAQGAMTGTASGKFSPNGTLTRAQVVRIFYNLYSYVPAPQDVNFPDVQDQWFADAVRWAAGHGIVSGSPEGLFKPNDPVTREQVAVMLYRLAWKSHPDLFMGSVGAVSFLDSLSIQEYAKDAVSALVGIGLLNGKPGNRFDPKGLITRGEMAKIMYTYHERTGDLQADYKIVRTGSAQELGAVFFSGMTNEDNIKIEITGFVVRFFGKIDTMDPKTLTDVVLTRDGTPIGNPVVFGGKVNNSQWVGQEVTDFLFTFADKVTEPGNYGMIGKYLGVPFTVYNIILEKVPLGTTPADAAKLKSTGYWGYEQDGRCVALAAFAFYFNGVQEVMRRADLTELKLTRDGEAIALEVEDVVGRELEVTDLGPETAFYLILKEPLVTPGVYKLSGKYRGTAFTTEAIQVGQ